MHRPKKWIDINRINKKINRVRDIAHLIKCLSGVPKTVSLKKKNCEFDPKYHINPGVMTHTIIPVLRKQS